MIGETLGDHYAMKRWKCLTKRSMMLALTAIILLLAGCSNGSKIEWQTKDFGPLTFEYPKDWVIPDLGGQFLAYISRESYSPAKPLVDIFEHLLDSVTFDPKKRQTL